MKVGAINILISNCTIGIYLRWWFNGWHYFNFQNGYEITMRSESMDTQVTRMFSVISKIERPTKLKAEYSYKVTLSGITSENIPGFTGLLMAEKVEQYEGGKWYEVEITRGSHLIKNPDTDSYIFDFEITRRELPYTSTVLQKTILLYIGDILCDLDDDEVIPINKQVNNIAEMQDRQSDFTAQFRIRKTRAMRALFELSGEVGANTTFPYEKQSCRLIQESVEMITNGEMILDMVDDQYYYVSLLSGNHNFFKDIGNLKITDLTLADHEWDITDIEASHVGSPEPDYVYPLCEPSDDAGIAPIRLAGNTVEMYGGYIWPFIRVETIWNAIFEEAGYEAEGDFLSNYYFDGMYMPVSSVKITKAHSDKYLYSAWWQGALTVGINTRIGFPGAVLINGTEPFRQGYFYLPFTGTYKITLTVNYAFGWPPTLAVYRGAAYLGDMVVVSIGLVYKVFEYEFTGDPDDLIRVLTSAHTYYYYSFAVTEIRDASIGYGSTVNPALHLPKLSQTEFIKMICNLFGLIPEAVPRDRKVRFWNYSELYDNMAIARDWSAYLSERDDETEFKFGDYAQNNWLRYKDSDDVILDNGSGIMQIDDETLTEEKDVVQLPVSTCDEVIIDTTIPTTVSRIDFNKWDEKTSAYIQNESIDPRIVFIKRAMGRIFKVWDDEAMTGGSVTINDPQQAASLEVSFSNLVVNYAALSRLLTKTNLRRAKFNLPVYEVAGLKHNIPIYLSQYKAYFYVNKINNYVPGKLNIVDLIKL